LKDYRLPLKVEVCGTPFAFVGDIVVSTIPTVCSLAEQFPIRGDIRENTGILIAIVIR
jgi:hypothetical protein